MDEIKNTFETIGIFDMFKGGFLIFIPTMAHVYIWGKMLMFVNSDRGKNIVALATVGAVTYYYCCLFYTFTDEIHMLWNYMEYASVSILLYVLVGFRLFSRVDTYLDTKFAKDCGDEDAKAKRAKRKQPRKWLWFGRKTSVKRERKPTTTSPAVKKKPTATTKKKTAP